MKKSYQLTNLDCANCAQKMEDAIRKLEGVQEISVSFFSQKFTITAEDNCFENIMKQVVKVCKRIEPGCRICL